MRAAAVGRWRGVDDLKRTGRADPIPDGTRHPGDPGHGVEFCAIRMQREKSGITDFSRQLGGREFAGLGIKGSAIDPLRAAPARAEINGHRLDRRQRNRPA